MALGGGMETDGWGSKKTEPVEREGGMRVPEAEARKPRGGTGVEADGGGAKPTRGGPRQRRGHRRAEPMWRPTEVCWAHGRGGRQ